MDFLTTYFRFSPGLQKVGLRQGRLPDAAYAFVALEAGQIVDRDFDILREVALSRWLTRPQIYQLALKDRMPAARLRRRLEILVRLGALLPVGWGPSRDEALRRVAYTLGYNGALLLKHYYGREFPWLPGQTRIHLARILAVLAANELRLQLQNSLGERFSRWELSEAGDRPTASFRIDGQVVVLEALRDSEQVWDWSPLRYRRWLKRPFAVLVLAQDEESAFTAFRALRRAVPPAQLFFTTDERAFGAAMDDLGTVWRWLGHKGEALEKRAFTDPWDGLLPGEDDGDVAAAEEEAGEVTHEGAVWDGDAKGAAGAEATVTSPPPPPPPGLAAAAPDSGDNHGEQVIVWRRGRR